MSFLKAEWRKLILVNFQVDESILRPYLPPKTALDTWNGIHYVSLVGFMFKNTKLLGIKIPFHTNFEEVNLRFYVKYKDGDNWKRGVVFIKEIVPRAALTFVANTFYQEHYVTRKMKHLWVEDNHSKKIQYQWKEGNQWQSFQVISELQASPIVENSESEFITEHYWGYTKIDDQTTFEYEVTHPTWKCYKVLDYDINIDFGKVYGNDFAFLQYEKPLSVMLAEGSTITVENKRKI